MGRFRLYWLKENDFTARVFFSKGVKSRILGMSVLVTSFVHSEVHWLALNWNCGPIFLKPNWFIWFEKSKNFWVSGAMSVKTADG